MSNFTQLNARAKKVLWGWLVALSIQEEPAKCAKVCDKSWVILTVHKVPDNIPRYSSKKLWCGQLYDIDSHQILTLPTFNIDSKQGQTFCKRVAPNSEVVLEFFFFHFKSNIMNVRSLVILNLPQNFAFERKCRRY